ncbi:MAG TPA: hypothetical protein VK928_07570, partial [Longimicrobiales bacterium]|nr:hypothetical protein [Longimicrobiales bacterium]
VRQRWYDEYFGSPVVTASRPVPGQAPTTMRRIEDYLVTREYLQIVRRRGTSLAFVPADDTISSVARAFTRSANRHFVSRATRVVVGVEPMPDQTSHVRFEMDLSEARQSAVKTGMTLGIMGGLLTGSVAAALLAPGVAPLPEVLGVAPSVIAFLGGLGGTTAASFSVAARRFRERAAAARLELNGMLDRLEHGERLEPPPAPWRRKLFGER